MIPPRVAERLVQGWRLTLGSNLLGGWYAELVFANGAVTRTDRVWSTVSPDAALAALEEQLEMEHANG